MRLWTGNGQCYVQTMEELGDEGMFVKIWPKISVFLGLQTGYRVRNVGLHLFSDFRAYFGNLVDNSTPPPPSPQLRIKKTQHDVNISP